MQPMSSVSSRMMIQADQVQRRYFNHENEMWVQAVIEVEISLLWLNIILSCLDGNKDQLTILYYKIMTVTLGNTLT